MSEIKYKSVNTISTLLDFNNTSNNEKGVSLFFVDLEETIMKSNVFHELISYPPFSEIFAELTKNFNDIQIKQVKHIGKNFKRELIEENTPAIIKELKKNSKVFALTSGCPSQYKKDQIIKLGVIFNGFLWTRGSPKGPFLLKFLEDKKLNGNCCFIDNDLSKILNVGQSFYNRYHHERSMHLLLYNRPIMHEISQNAFIKYWTDVIKAIKNNTYIKYDYLKKVK